MKRRNILIMIAAVAILGLGLSWGRISQAVTEDVKPRIALTFDDGPHPVYTPKLLDGLKERNVKATFFVVGKNIEGREDIIKRMDGLPEEEACAQITKTSELVKEITGKNTEFVRPPFGAWDKKLECGFEMFPVLWSIDPLDWTTKNVDAVVQKVLSRAEENSIILLHDYYDSSVEAALKIVDALLERGFEFVTVDELVLE